MTMLVPLDAASGHDGLAEVRVGERRRKEVVRVSEVRLGRPSAISGGAQRMTVSWDYYRIASRAFGERDCDGMTSW